MQQGPCVCCDSDHQRHFPPTYLVKEYATMLPNKQETMNCLLRNATHSHCNRDIFIRSNRGFLDNQRLGPVFTPIHSIPSIHVYTLYNIYIYLSGHIARPKANLNPARQSPRWQGIHCRNIVATLQLDFSAVYWSWIFGCVLVTLFIAEQNPKQTC